MNVRLGIPTTAAQMRPAQIQTEVILVHATVDILEMGLLVQVWR